MLSYQCDIPPLKSVSCALTIRMASVVKLILCHHKMKAAENRFPFVRSGFADVR